MRALTSHQCGPGSNPDVDPSCGLSFCWFSPLLSEVFLQLLCFPLFSKLIFPNSNSTRNQLDEEPLSGCVLASMSLFIIYYLLLFLWDVSFMKRVLLNKFLVHVLSLFFSCYSK